VVIGTAVGGVKAADEVGVEARMKTGDTWCRVIAWLFLKKLKGTSTFSTFS
jgi:hypothetical protein